MSRCNALALAALALPLLLAACNNRWPPPPPVPGQPLTWAQKHYQDMQRQQRWRDERFP